jgi:hypothetical protein
MPLAGQKARIAARGPTSARKSGRTAKSMPPAELTSRKFAVLIIVLILILIRHLLAELISLVGAQGLEPWTR